jgi:acetyltransferase
MSVRNLDKRFRPQSVALIGATPRPGSVGVVARNLRRAGFAGELMLVNPHYRSIDGLTVYPDVARLPQTPDLAVIATPPETVPRLIGELGERGTRGAVVITAGFGEQGDRGHALEQAALEAAKPHLLRIVGPNCVGIMVPKIGLDASFSHLAAPPGTSPSSANRGPLSPPCSTGRRPVGSAFRISSLWGIWRMSILVRNDANLSPCAKRVWDVESPKDPSCCEDHRHQH